MAREMTPHERAAALIEQMLVFIEKTSRRKLSFSAIVDMNTGKTENPQDRLVAAVMKHDTDTRRAALLEACVAVSQFSSDGRPIDAQELRIALVQLLGEMAK